MKDNWRESLKVGDEVAVHNMRGSGRIDIVARLTKTMIILPGGSRYCKKSGNRFGGGIWDSAFLGQPTKELRDQIEKDHILKKIVGSDLKSLDINTLKAIHGILKETARKKMIDLKLNSKS